MSQTFRVNLMFKSLKWHWQYRRDAPPKREDRRYRCLDKTWMCVFHFNRVQSNMNIYFGRDYMYLQQMIQKITTTKVDKSQFERSERDARSVWIQNTFWWMLRTMSQSPQQRGIRKVRRSCLKYSFCCHVYNNKVQGQTRVVLLPATPKGALESNHWDVFRWHFTYVFVMGIIFVWCAYLENLEKLRFCSHVLSLLVRNNNYDKKKWIKEPSLMTISMITLMRLLLFDLLFVFYLYLL